VTAVPIHKLTTTDAFVHTDLPGAPSTGVVRVARKVLTSSAADLARSVTYSFAVFELQRGGASAGINAEGEDVVAAQDRFVDEIRPLVVDGLHLDAGKGFDPAALAPLGEADARGPAAGSATVTAAGVVAAAEAALGPLEGRTVGVEGVDAGPVPMAVAAAAVERGARIVAASTAGESVSNAGGIELEALRRPSLAEAGDTDKAPKFWGTSADLVFCGSRPGVLNHQGTAFVRTTAVVPWGPVPLTTKALIDLGKAGVMVVPDFVAIAGGVVGGYLDGDEPAVAQAATERIAALITDLHGHAEGPFLGACLQAEAFLRTWQDQLPFGRPLAA
jgi:glutamate dehydrogenase/leucine dehydrogenase